MFHAQLKQIREDQPELAEQCDLLLALPEETIGQLQSLAQGLVSVATSAQAGVRAQVESEVRERVLAVL